MAQSLTDSGIALTPASSPRKFTVPFRPERSSTPAASGITTTGDFLRRKSSLDATLALLDRVTVLRPLCSRRAARVIDISERAVRKMASLVSYLLKIREQMQGPGERVWLHDRVGELRAQCNQSQVSLERAMSGIDARAAGRRTRLMRECLAMTLSELLSPAGRRKSTAWLRGIK